MIQWMRDILRKIKGQKVTRRAMDEAYWHRQPPLTKDQLRVRIRLQHLLGWLTDPDWMDLTDHEFIMAVFKEYEKFYGRPLIDPNE